jgi:hypothetical protein
MTSSVVEEIIDGSATACTQSHRLGAWTRAAANCTESSIVARGCFEPTSGPVFRNGKEGRLPNSKMLGFLCNCFWLLIPILAFNLLFMRQLPAAFQANVFWNQIPRAISVPENVLRTLVMVLPVFMRLRVSTPGQKLGAGLYLTGLFVYFASWAVLIAFPQCEWSTSAFGFVAPAYTPILWLTGIALIGDELLIPRIPFKPYMYWTLSAFFLLFHNLHAALVFSRGI